jgi:uncharacterized protein (DUF983 family)
VIGLAGRRVGPLRTVGRGLRRRCGRCGGRRLFRGWFRLRERCPTCGYTFRREEGFSTGVFLINFAVTEGLMWLSLMAYILWRAGTDPDAALWPVLTACLGFAVLAPIAFYPFATSTWAALDLVLRPLEPDEEADAVTWVASQFRPGA